jgi:hypothetical protein
MTTTVKLRRAGAVLFITALASGAVPAVAQASTTTAAQVAARALAANNAYPYTQLSITVPQLSGPGVPAWGTKLATGLKLVVASQQAVPGRSAAGELTVYYLGTELGQVRAVGGNLYVLADVAHWSSLPVPWGASGKSELSTIDLAVGERWFELQAATVKRLEGTTAASSPLRQVGPSPAALRNLVATAAAKFVGGLSFKEAPSAGGNFTFSAHGALQALAANALAAGRALHLTTASGLPKGDVVPNGTWSLVMSTTAAGRYIAHVGMGLQAARKGSISLSLAFAHAVEPVVTPSGAKVVTPSMLSGMGLFGTSSAA